MYLQASNTHPAERAVKEAKLVSQTGTREEMRSVVAIGRSYLLPECDKLKGKERAQRALELVCAQHSRLTDHDGTIKEANTSPRRADVLMALKGGGHFRKTRLERKKDKIVSQNKNKKKNVAQKKTGVDLTDLVAGLVRFSSIGENKFQTAVDQELVHRGISLRTTENGVDKEAKIREKVKRLRQHEAALKDKPIEEVEAFAPQSEADFHTGDETGNGVPNVLSKKKKKTGATRKMASLDKRNSIAGLVPFSRITKKKYKVAINQELVHRGISLCMTVNGKEKEGNIREKVKQLQQHEATLQDKTMEDVKTFTPQSEADFRTDVP
jgi:hypothetical protein